MRIHELAKELGVPSKDILASLEAMGYEGRTASSTVPDEAVPRIRAAGGHVTAGVKPRTATVEQLKREAAVSVRVRRRQTTPEIQRGIERMVGEITREVGLRDAIGRRHTAESSRNFPFSPI